MDRTFPEGDVQGRFPADEAGAPAYIGSSEQVEEGHEQSMNRMPPITNEEFPNTESGEGLNNG